MLALSWGKVDNDDSETRINGPVRDLSRRTACSGRAVAHNRTPIRATRYRAAVVGGERLRRRRQQQGGKGKSSPTLASVPAPHETIPPTDCRRYVARRLSSASLSFPRAERRSVWDERARDETKVKPFAFGRRRAIHVRMPPRQQSARTGSKRGGSILPAIVTDRNPSPSPDRKKPNPAPPRKNFEKSLPDRRAGACALTLGLASGMGHVEAESHTSKANACAKTEPPPTDTDKPTPPTTTAKLLLLLPLASRGTVKAATEYKAAGPTRVRRACPRPSHAERSLSCLRDRKINEPIDKQGRKAHRPRPHEGDPNCAEHISSTMP